MSTDPQPSTQRSAAAPDPQLDAPPPPQQQHKIRHTRISGLWFAVAFFGVVLLFLLIFILQNGRHVGISYLGMHGNLPLGVALLFSAVCGALLTILAGAARISQLHAVARRHRRADARRVAGTTSAPAAASPPPGPAR